MNDRYVSQLGSLASRRDAIRLDVNASLSIGVNMRKRRFLPVALVTGSLLCASTSATSAWAAAVHRNVAAANGVERFLSDEQFARLSGSRALTDLLPVSEDFRRAPAVPPNSWNQRVKVWSRDANGLRIPTRFGNGELGWSHFSGAHNITNPRVIQVTTSEHPEAQTPQEQRGNPHRLKYGGVLVDRRGHVIARVQVWVQNDKRTQDGRYWVTDGSGIVGVITAYCVGQNRCPDALNRV